jgi:O-antigen/teichoic acid export membrane protein
VLFTILSANNSDVAEAAIRPSRWSGIGQQLAELRHPHKIKDELRRRSIGRYRRMVLTAGTSLAAKGIPLLSTIALLPLSFRYLGAERYGLWVTITSFVLFLGFADLGIGNGLTVRIAQADGADNQESSAVSISAAFYFLLPLSILLLAASAWATHSINLGTFYGVRSPLANSEAGAATLFLLICTFAAMPLSIVLRVETGFQQGFVADLWNAAGNLLGFVAVILVIRQGGGLPAMVLAMAGLPQLVTACNWIVQFFFIRPNLRPRLRLFHTRVALSLLAMGGLFVVQQCFGLIYYVSDNLVIARTMGLTEVARYAVIQRFFSVGFVTQYLVMPLWPAVGEALARRDFAWASRTARRAIFLTVSAGLLFSVPLLLSSRYLIRLWSSIDPGPIDLLRLGFAVWVIFIGYIAAMNAILNQELTLRRHLVILGAATLSSLAIKIWFAVHGSLAGVIWGSNIAFGVIYVVPTLLLAFKHLPAVSQEA